MNMAWGQLGMAMVTLSSGRTPMVRSDLAHLRMLLHQPAVGGGPAHEVEGHVIRVLLRNLLHRLEHRALKIFKMRRHLAYISSHGVLT
jgi:hypothetical protein